MPPVPRSGAGGFLLPGGLQIALDALNSASYDIRMLSRFRNIRHRLDMKQSDYAQLFELDKSSVSRIEIGAQGASAGVEEKLDLIEAALDKDPEVGARLMTAWKGLDGFLRTHAAWVVLVGSTGDARAVVNRARAIARGTP